ncbi:AMP-binding protein [Proteus mirabilis]|nr:AMP-binding protein [Proteus mirabilis]
MINNNNLYDYHIIRRLQMQFSSSGEKTAYRQWEAKSEIAMSWASVAKKNTCTLKCITRYGRGSSRKCGDFFPKQH